MSMKYWYDQYNITGIFITSTIIILTERVYHVYY